MIFSFKKVFGNLNQKWRQGISDLYMKIADKCDPSQPLENKIHCNEPASMTLCSAEIAPVAYMKEGQVILCPKSWEAKYEESVCGEDNDRAGIFVHEFMHMFTVAGVQILDYAYADQAKFYKLLPKGAVMNADSYTFFARSKFSSIQTPIRLFFPFFSCFL